MFTDYMNEKRLKRLALVGTNSQGKSYNMLGTGGLYPLTLVT